MSCKKKYLILNKNGGHCGRGGEEKKVHERYIGKKNPARNRAQPSTQVPRAKETAFFSPKTERKEKVGKIKGRKKVQKHNKQTQEVPPSPVSFFASPSNNSKKVKGRQEKLAEKRINRHPRCQNESSMSPMIFIEQRKEKENIKQIPAAQKHRRYKNSHIVKNRT